MIRRSALVGLLAILLAAQPATAEAPSIAPAAPSPIAPPPKGLGQIVFFRAGRPASAAYGCTVNEDNKLLSHLDSARYFVAGAGPGVHNFTAGSNVRIFKLPIETGKTYYVQCSIGMGEFEGRPSLWTSSEDKFAQLALNRMAPPTQAAKPSAPPAAARPAPSQDGAKASSPPPK